MSKPVSTTLDATAHVTEVAAVNAEFNEAQAQAQAKEKVNNMFQTLYCVNPKKKKGRSVKYYFNVVSEEGEPPIKKLTANTVTLTRGHVNKDVWFVAKSDLTWQQIRAIEEFDMYPVLKVIEGGKEFDPTPVICVSTSGKNDYMFECKAPTSCIGSEMQARIEFRSAFYAVNLNKKGSTDPFWTGPEDRPMAPFKPLGLVPQPKIRQNIT